MLAAIVIAKNEQQMIAGCLKSLQFADEIIVVDTGSTDQTISIAKKLRAKVLRYHGPADFSAWRNFSLSHTTADWLLFVDADEQVSTLLAKEIISEIVKNNTASAYALLRDNYYLGKKLKYGGWGGDFVIRLLKRSEFKSWQGSLHEQPQFTGKLVHLTKPLLHYSHRTLSSMLTKSLLFTDYEAKLRIQAKHPPVVSWRIFRVMLTEFIHRFFRLSAWRDGPEGIIDGIFQVYNTFIIYARLWELQAKNENH